MIFFIENNQKNSGCLNKTTKCKDSFKSNLKLIVHW